LPPEVFEKHRALQKASYESELADIVHTKAIDKAKKIWSSLDCDLD
jgi:hypothetical protein